MYIMCSFSRFQYKNIHCVTLENYVIKRIAIEHCWLYFLEIYLYKNCTCSIYISETSRIQETTKIQAHFKKVDNVLSTTGTMTTDVIEVNFLHTSSTFLLGTLKTIYEYGASTVVYTFYYLAFVTLLNYINLLSSTAVKINDQNKYT